jgi:uncharacterized protein YacL
MNGSLLMRVVGMIAVATTALVWQPTGAGVWPDLLLGMALALVLFWVQRRAHAAPVANLAGAVLAGAVALAVAGPVGEALLIIGGGGPRASFAQALILLVLPWLGASLGWRHGRWLEPARWWSLSRSTSTGDHYKVLDTSVIIDGRVADLCQAGFLEGTMVIPQFVLRELQNVADSTDPSRRNRGRRGLDILQTLQKMEKREVHISDIDYPEIRDVDLKLIELARRMPGSIVTNDVNLSKVAQVRGVPVLNINELANALKPVALPGELMRVVILKEGKEPNQGVAYLDDGTMVVVDHARRHIGRTVDISVTSVLQTSAGKMIFGRLHESVTGPGPVAVAVSSGGQ